MWGDSGRTFRQWRSHSAALGDDTKKQEPGQQCIYRTLWSGGSYKPPTITDNNPARKIESHNSQSIYLALANSQTLRAIRTQRGRESPPKGKRQPNLFRLSDYLRVPACAERIRFRVLGNRNSAPRSPCVRSAHEGDLYPQVILPFLFAFPNFPIHWRSSLFWRCAVV